MRAAKLFLAIAMLLMLTRATASADNTAFMLTSSTAQTPLIELFSSEGCSSCPPAEEWLTKLRTQPGLWTQFVPLQFHVDYWDNLGWTDVYAKKEFTERQQKYAAEFQSNSVYTPEFVVSGKESRLPSAANLQSVTGNNAGILQVQRATDGSFQARFTPQAPVADGLQLYGALLGNGIKTKVLAGENRGATLGHDFVVLSLRDAKFIRQGMSFTAALRLDSAPMIPPAASYSAAFWVTSTSSLVPIQAVGGELPQ